jgi:hypothetical protein
MPADHWTQPPIKAWRAMLITASIPVAADIIYLLQPPGAGWG